MPGGRRYGIPGMVRPARRRRSPLSSGSCTTRSASYSSHLPQNCPPLLPGRATPPGYRPAHRNRAPDRSLGTPIHLPASWNVRRECPLLVGAFRSAPAISCAGPISPPRPRRSTSATSPRSPSEPYAATHTEEPNMFSPDLDPLTQFEQISTIGDVIAASLRIEEISPEDAKQLLHSHASGRREYAVRRVVSRNRSARVRDVHGRGDHRKAGATFPRLGRRSRRVLSGLMSPGCKGRADCLPSPS